LEQQLSALLCEKAELEKSKVDLEEKVSRWNFVLTKWILKKFCWKLNIYL
jgi:hypothetical protein